MVYEDEYVTDNKNSCFMLSYTKRLQLLQGDFRTGALSLSLDPTGGLPSPDQLG